MLHCGTKEMKANSLENEKKSWFDCRLYFNSGLILIMIKTKLCEDFLTSLLANNL